jgi:hypothetical protein
VPVRRGPFVGVQEPDAVFLMEKSGKLLFDDDWIEAARRRDILFHFDMRRRGIIMGGSNGNPTELPISLCRIPLPLIS